jgi:hypothetical protein
LPSGQRTTERPSSSRWSSVEALIGLSALHRRSRDLAVATGFAVALAIWVIAQDVGQLYTGQATDPNSGPLIAVLAIAVLGVCE